MGRSQCIEKIKHDVPECGSHSLQVFLNEDGTYTGYCFSCSTLVSDPYKDKPKDYKPQKVGKTPEEIDDEINAIMGYKSAARPERKLSKETHEYFGVKVGVSEEDGITPTTVFYPRLNKDGELVGYKVKMLDKKRMWVLEKEKGTLPFGWDKAKHADGKTIFITEGEEDAMSLYQELRNRNAGTQWADLVPPVISLPNGASSAKRDLVLVQRELGKFEKVVLVFDMDEPGRKAAESVLELLPNAHVVELPEKDFNDCVKAGKTKQALTAVLFKNAKPNNTRIVMADDNLHEAAAIPPEWGIPWPFPGINDATRGIRTGETIYIGAGCKGLRNTSLIAGTPHVGNQQRSTITEGYSVTPEGLVINLKSGRVLKTDVNKSGHHRVTMSRFGKTNRQYLHRLVAEVYVPNPEHKPYVNHIDGNKDNNHFTNLEWVTCQENTVHAFDTGLRPSGEDSYQASLSQHTVEMICILISQGVVRSKIMEITGANKSQVDDIRRRRSWKRVSSKYQW